MKTFVQYLQEKDYAENTVESYSFAICQLIDKTGSSVVSVGEIPA